MLLLTRWLVATQYSMFLINIHESSSCLAHGTYKRVPTLLGVESILHQPWQRSPDWNVKWSHVLLFPGFQVNVLFFHHGDTTKGNLHNLLPQESESEPTIVYDDDHDHARWSLILIKIMEPFNNQNRPACLHWASIRFPSHWVWETPLKTDQVILFHCRNHNSTMIHFSVIDFHGLEDKVIPYDITSAKGNITVPTNKI